MTYKLCSQTMAICVLERLRTRSMKPVLINLSLELKGWRFLETLAFSPHQTPRKLGSDISEGW